jgi:hypothetical protein
MFSTLYYFECRSLYIDQADRVQCQSEGAAAVYSTQCNMTADDDSPGVVLPETSGCSDVLCGTSHPHQGSRLQQGAPRRPSQSQPARPWLWPVLCDTCHRPPCPAPKLQRACVPA